MSRSIKWSGLQVARYPLVVSGFTPAPSTVAHLKMLALPFQRMVLRSGGVSSPSQRRQLIRRPPRRATEPRFCRRGHADADAAVHLGGALKRREGGAGALWLAGFLPRASINWMNRRRCSRLPSGRFSSWCSLSGFDGRSCCAFKGAHSPNSLRTESISVRGVRSWGRSPRKLTAPLAGGPGSRVFGPLPPVALVDLSPAVSVSVHREGFQRPGAGEDIGRLIQKTPIPPPDGPLEEIDLPKCIRRALQTPAPAPGRPSLPLVRCPPSWLALTRPPDPSTPPLPPPEIPSKFRRSTG